MKAYLLIYLVALAAVPGAVRCNWEEMVKTIDQVFVDSLAGSSNGKYVPEAEIDKLSIDGFRRAKEQDKGNFKEEEPPKQGQIKEVYKVKSVCLVIAPETKIEPEFCYQIWIKPAPPMPGAPAGGAGKSKMFTILVFLTNSVVYKRIKITLASGTGNNVIRTVMYNGIMKYLSKVGQSVSSLLPLLPEINNNLSELLKVIGEAVVQDKSPVVFKVTPYNHITGAHTKEEFVIKPLVDGKEGADKLSEADLFTKPIFKLFEERKAAHKFVSRSGKPGPVPAEFLLFRIEQDTSTGDTNDDFTDYVKRIFLVIINIEGRLSVHLISNIFTYSKDLPAATKPLLLNTLTQLLQKTLVETYTSFVVLNMDRPTNMPDEVIVSWFNGIMTTVPAPRKFEPVAGKTNEYSVSYFSYTIQVKGYLLPAHGAFAIRVLLNQAGNVVLDRSGFYPLQSQHISVPIMKSFIQKSCNQYYETILSSLIVPRYPEGNEGTAHVVMGKYTLADTEVEEMKTVLELRTFLSQDQNNAFVNDEGFEKVVDTSVSALSTASDPDAAAGLLKFQLGQGEAPKDKNVAYTSIRPVSAKEASILTINEVDNGIVQNSGLKLTTFEGVSVDQYSTRDKMPSQLVYQTVVVN